MQELKKGENVNIPYCGSNLLCTCDGSKWLLWQLLNMYTCKVIFIQRNAYTITDYYTFSICKDCFTDSDIKHRYTVTVIWQQYTILAPAWRNDP